MITSSLHTTRDSVDEEALLILCKYWQEDHRNQDMLRSLMEILARREGKLASLLSRE